MSDGWKVVMSVVAIIFMALFATWLVIFFIIALDVTGALSYIDPVTLACYLFDAKDILCQ